MSEVRLIERIHQIMEEGAGIIDIGACSTRPGASCVDEKEELGRLSWAVELVRKYYPHALISIDTFRASVVEEINSCLGPVIVNDISGGTMDDRMFETVAKNGLTYIMMHIQGIPETMQENPYYEDVVAEVGRFFADRISRLTALGCDDIILDPGFGFGKDMIHNYRLMDGMDTFLKLGYPLLVGISRKSMIYKLLGGGPEDALNGTSALNMAALLKGAAILRVHDVKAAIEVVRIYNALSGRY